jgi:hypothetical protein
MRTIEQDTPILPYVIADSVIRELARYLHREHSIDLDNAADLETALSSKADRCYQHNAFFAKRIRGASGRDYLYAFMRHWLSAEVCDQRPGLRYKIPARFMNGIEI